MIRRAWPPPVYFAPVRNPITGAKPLSIANGGMRRWVFGHCDSNGNGTQVCATFGGVAVHAGWTVRDAGVNLANYPAGTTPSVGMVPFLIERLIADGVNSGTRYVIRRALNGADATWPGTMASQATNIIADVAALGGDPQVGVFILGANDAIGGNPAINSLADNLIRGARIMRSHYPSILLAFCLERTSDPGTYTNLMTTGWNQIAIAAATMGNAVLVNSDQPSAVAMADAIHWSESASGGQDTMADRLVDRVTAASA